MLSPFALYLVTDQKQLGSKNLLDVVQCAIDHGVTAVQLREKTLSLCEFTNLAAKIKDLLYSSKIPLIINDHLDVAIQIKADGIHLGQNDLSYHEARKNLPSKMIFGLSVENREQAKLTESFELSYLGLSTIFKSFTKPEARMYWNHQNIRELKKNSPHKLIGIGGINLSNIQEALNLGLDGVALSSEICGAETLKQVATKTKQLRKIVETHFENL